MTDRSTLRWLVVLAGLSVFGSSCNLLFDYGSEAGAGGQGQGAETGVGGEAERRRRHGRMRRRERVRRRAGLHVG